MLEVKKDFSIAGTGENYSFHTSYIETLPKSACSMISSGLHAEEHLRHRLKTPTTVSTAEIVSVV